MGGRKCLVDGCDSKSFDPLHPNRLSFFSFPSNQQCEEKWREAIFLLNGQKLPDVLSRYAVVCENHFCENDKIRTGERFNLNRVAVPSLFLNKHQSKWTDDLENPAEYLTIVKCESIDQQEEVVNEIYYDDANYCSIEKSDTSSGGEKNQNEHFQTMNADIEYTNGFPTDSEVAEHWSLIIKELNNQKDSFEYDTNSVICGWHFASHYKIICGTKCHLQISAIPTVFGNYNEEQPFVTLRKEYSCERCGHINSVTTSLKGNLFDGSQTSQESKASLDCVLFTGSSSKNDPLALASSQISSANMGSNLQVHPKQLELSTSDTQAKKKKRVFYPGDVRDDEELGEETSQKYITVLKKKILDHRKQTRTLTQRNRRYEKKISTLKTLLKELMEKTMSEQNAVES